MVEAELCRFPNPQLLLVVERRPFLLLNDGRDACVDMKDGFHPVTVPNSPVKVNGTETSGARCR
jgi:hypothetical protein